MIAEYISRKPLTLKLSYAEKSKKRLVFLEGLKEQLPVVKYLLIGLLIASIIKTYAPIQLTAYISQSPLAYPLISLVAIPIYVCSEEDVVLGKAMLDVGFTTGQAMTFMLASSGVCLPAIFATMPFFPNVRSYFMPVVGFCFL